MWHTHADWMASFEYLFIKAVKEAQKKNSTVQCAQWNPYFIVQSVSQTVYEINVYALKVNKTNLMCTEKNKTWKNCSQYCSVGNFFFFVIWSLFLCRFRPCLFPTAPNMYSIDDCLNNRMNRTTELKHRYTSLFYRKNYAQCKRMKHIIWHEAGFYYKLPANENKNENKMNGNWRNFK